MAVGSRGKLGKPRVLRITGAYRYPQDPRRVYRALSQEVDRWWSESVRLLDRSEELRLSPTVGSHLLETGKGGASWSWAVVTAAIPGELLELTGRFGMLDSVEGTVRFRLEKAKKGTTLALTQLAVGLLNKDHLRSYIEGWDELLGRRLRKHLARTA